MKIKNESRRNFLVGGMAASAAAMLPQNAIAFGAVRFASSIASSFLSNLAVSLVSDSIQEYIADADDNQISYAARKANEQMMSEFPDMSDSQVFAFENHRMFFQKSKDGKRGCTAVLALGKDEPVGLLDLPMMAIANDIMAKTGFEGNIAAKRFVPEQWIMLPFAKTDGSYRNMNVFKTKQKIVAMDYSRLNENWDRYYTKFYDLYSDDVHTFTGQIPTLVR